MATGKLSRWSRSESLPQRVLVLFRSDRRRVLPAAVFVVPHHRSSVGSLRQATFTPPDDREWRAAAAEPGAVFVSGLSPSRCRVLSLSRMRIGSDGCPCARQVGMMGAYALWALSRSFAVFLLFRVMGGVCKGNVGLCTAVVADMADPKARHRGMVSASTAPRRNGESTLSASVLQAMIGVAFSVGFTAGPLMGAWLAVSYKSAEHVFFQTPALLALAFSAADLLFIWLMLPETLLPSAKVG